MPSREQILELLDNCVWPENSTEPETEGYAGSWFIANWCGCGPTRCGLLLVSKNNGNKLYLPTDGYVVTQDGTTSRVGMNSGKTKYVDAAIWSGSYYLTANDDGTGCDTAAMYDLHYIVDSDKTPEQQRQTLRARHYYGANIRPVKRNVREQDTVDLGLPSGTLWCTKNYGADNELERGDLIQWSDVPSAGDYVTPTEDQWSELLENADWELSTNYNGTFVTGWKVTSKTYPDRYIFLPATGCILDDVQYVAADAANIKEGLYWTATVSSDAAAYLARFTRNATDGEVRQIISGYRTCRIAVRQVKNA